MVLHHFTTGPAHHGRRRVPYGTRKPRTGTASKTTPPLSTPPYMIYTPPYEIMWCVMLEKSTMWLHSVSVVITAESHNPSILNKDFLVTEGIVPKEWAVRETIITPAASTVQYANGIRWLVDQQRLEISRELDVALHEYADSQIHDLAVSYVKKLPHVPYRSLGLNCTVSVMREDPLQWLTDRFLSVDLPDVKMHMMPRFTADLDGAVLNLRMNGGDVMRDGGNKSSVVIDCNLHSDGPFKADSLCDAIRRWVDDQDRIAVVLGKILG